MCLECFVTALVFQLTEARSEIEEQQRQVINLKRKCQRLTQDVGDMKLHLEEQVMRNAELEKKQRKLVAFVIFIERFDFILGK